MFGITVLLKDQVLFFFSFFLKMLSLDGKIGGNLSIGTATLNSIGLKEKANLMPRGEKISEFVPTLLVPFPPAPPPQKKKKYSIPVLLILRISGGSIVQSSL